MDRVFAVHAGSRGLDSQRRHISERFLRSSRPGYPLPVCSELENSGVRVVVGDCSVTEYRRWRPPLSYRQSCTRARKTLQTRGRAHGAGCARPWLRTAEPLGKRRDEKWITKTWKCTHSYKL